MLGFLFRVEAFLLPVIQYGTNNIRKLVYFLETLTLYTKLKQHAYFSLVAYSNHRPRLIIKIISMDQTLLIQSLFSRLLQGSKQKINKYQEELDTLYSERDYLICERKRLEAQQEQILDEKYSLELHIKKTLEPRNTQYLTMVEKAYIDHLSQIFEQQALQDQLIIVKTRALELNSEKATQTEPTSSKQEQ